MRWVWILTVMFVLAACGGNDAEGSVDNPATSGGDPTSTDTQSTATQEPDDRQQEASAGLVAFSGAESGEITDNGSCGGGPDGEGLQLFTSYYDDENDRTWMLQIYVREYVGPGDYEVGDSNVSSGAVNFSGTVVSLGSSGADAETWGSTKANGGTVVVHSDETSGAVDAVLTVEDDSSEIHVSGTWNCSAL